MNRIAIISVTTVSTLITTIILTTTIAVAHLSLTHAMIGSRGIIDERCFFDVLGSSSIAIVILSRSSPSTPPTTLRQLFFMLFAGLQEQPLGKIDLLGR